MDKTPSNDPNESSKVKLWSRVRIQNVRANVSKRIIIVPPLSARSSGAVPADDPLAIALIGRKKGEWIQVEQDGVSETILILSVIPGPDSPEWWA